MTIAPYVRENSSLLIFSTLEKAASPTRRAMAGAEHTSASATLPPTSSENLFSLCVFLGPFPPSLKFTTNPLTDAQPPPSLPPRELAPVTTREERLGKGRSWKEERV